jgi:hypothetical protein
MDANRARELVDVAIKNAEFDRERFRVRAIEVPDGTEISVYADTRERNANGQLSTNYNPILIEDITDDVACAGQLRMVIELMVSGLEDFINSEVKPDGQD